MKAVENPDFGEAVPHEGLPSFIAVRSTQEEREHLLDSISSVENISYVRRFDPVLLVRSRKDLKVPFITVEEMLDFNSDKNLNLWELAVQYESIRGSITHQEVFEKMGAIADIMQNSIDLGLKGTHYEDRILGSQSLNFKKNLEAKKLVPGDVLNNSIMFTSAMMEVKSSMGVIVAAPTAG